MTAPERDTAREALLTATLPHVAFDGWTETAMETGARDAGMETVALRRFFPGGPAEMVRLFSDRADAAMTEAVLAADLGTLKIRERIALAVRARLEGLAPHREAARRALAFFARPPHAALGVKCLYRTVDATWYAIGDRSVDFSFYTKRALLAGVYGATTLYWLDDRSEGSADSWDFLDRRIEDVMRIQKVRGRLEQAASYLPDPRRLARQFATPRR